MKPTSKNVLDQSCLDGQSSPGSPCVPIEQCIPIELPTRRQWFKQAGCFASAGLYGASILSSSNAQAEPLGNSHAGDDRVMLRPKSDQNLFRVRMEMEVKGNVDIAANPLVSRTSSAKLPITSDAVFDYEERFRRADAERPATFDVDQEVTYIDRYYHESTADSQLNRTKQLSQLRESVRDTVVRRETLPEVIYPADDYFTRSELEMLRLPVSSIGIDGLLPSEAVSEGFTYKPSLDGLASALNLTSVDESKIEAEVVSLTEKQAKVHLKGSLEGSVEGVPTKIRTVGKLMFDRQAGVCSWLAIALHETREIGLAEPGFDVAATIKMVREPLKHAVGLTKARSIDVTKPLPSDRMFVDLVSEKMNFAALMNREWRMMTDVPGTAMMRMIDTDRSIAQCDFRPLASMEPGTQLTLEAFTEDVQRTLGEQLVEVVEADQQVAATGLRVLRVAAKGAVEGVPIHWVLMHFSDDQGHRVQATFTLEADKLRRFAGSDAQLANSLRFVGLPSIEASEKTTEVAASSKTPESTRIADAIAGDSGDDQVQSMSDLK